MSPIDAGAVTDHNSSGTGGSTATGAGTGGGGLDPSSSGAGNSTVGATGAGVTHYYSSGATKIGVQTHDVIHKMIKIPKKVPKNAKLVFLFCLWLQ